MGPKKGKGAADKKAAEDEREEPLQAVILADAYETRFSPFTRETPRCLLPLANTPLLEYSLEQLASAGVEEVFVYLSSHTAQVEEYILNSKWSTASPTNSSPFSNLEIIRSTSRSVGDSMRDLDRRSILKNDFILCYGDVVATVPLEPILAAHRERKAKDKNAIMTMVLREADQKHRTNVHGYSPVFVIDPSNDRCLHYQQIFPHATERSVDIDPELLTSHDELEVRTDLIDCGIDICTPDVLALWSDNFDFQAPRRGFLFGVLTDYELNGKTIHVHVEKDHYAARVRNLHAYDSVSKDIVSRWSYPLCPDSNLLRGQSYRLLKGNIYKEEHVILARSCVINRGTVIGEGTSVGEGTVISNSIIGRGCMIGRNVTIEGAYIWGDALIGDGSVIKQAIIANEAVVGKKCTVEPGALLSYAVQIADGTTVKGTTRVTRAKRKREADEHEVPRGETDFAIVGQKGEGFDFETDEDDKDDEVEKLADASLVYNLSELALSQESISTLNSDSDISGEPISQRDRSATSSFLSIASDDSESPQQAHHFLHEATNTILDQMRKGEDPDNIVLELNSFRMAQDASDHQVRRSVAHAFMKHMTQLVESGLAISKAVSEVILPNKTLIGRYIDKNQPTADEVDFMLLFQTDALVRKDGDLLLKFVTYELVKRDLISIDGIEEWWNDARGVETEELKKIREKTQEVVDAVLPDSEESDDEEEESEEESDEE